MVLPRIKCYGVAHAAIEVADIDDRGAWLAGNGFVEIGRGRFPTPAGKRRLFAAGGGGDTFEMALYESDSRSGPAIELLRHRATPAPLPVGEVGRGRVALGFAPPGAPGGVTEATVTSGDPGVWERLLGEVLNAGRDPSDPARFLVGMAILKNRRLPVRPAAAGPAEPPLPGLLDGVGGISLCFAVSDVAAVGESLDRRGLSAVSTGPMTLDHAMGGRPVSVRYAFHRLVDHHIVEFIELR